MASCGVRHFALEYYHSPRGPHSAYTRPCIPAFQQSSNPAYGGVLCAPALPREQQTLAHQQVQAQDICVQPPLPNSPAQARNFIPAKACSSCQGSAFLCCQGCQDLLALYVLVRRRYRPSFTRRVSEKTIPSKGADQLKM
eukprot:scaffold139030_cov18-Tisochrysis_lutea.AAC.1